MGIVMDGKMAPEDRIQRKDGVRDPSRELQEESRKATLVPVRDHQLYCPGWEQSELSYDRTSQNRTLRTLYLK